MKAKLIPLIGDPKENLYQLGLSERGAFLRLEEKVTKLLSQSPLIRAGQEMITKMRTLLKKKEESFFDECLKSYTEGLGIDVNRYKTFLTLFEMAAHYGQSYPELKGFLPGCTSVFESTPEGMTHSRLLDFPLLGFFDEEPRLYYWKFTGRQSLLTYSTPGLAPLFFHVLHESGFTLAIHHKPGSAYHKDGSSIFQVAFETLFEVKEFSEVRSKTKNKTTMTKWCFLLLDKKGQVQVIDMDGPSSNFEVYDLKEAKRLIFTNTPINHEQGGFENYLQFSRDRGVWLKDKLEKKSKAHILDVMTDVSDQKLKNWVPSSGTLSTVGAIHMHLGLGYVDIKVGKGALVASDSVMRFPLNDGMGKILKQEEVPTPFEKSWKRASRAQYYFDQGQMDLAYHELQMALTLMPHKVWKNILKFYLILWDFRYVSNSKELSLIYRELKALEIPPQLHDQWLIQIMRFEKVLGLAPSIQTMDLKEEFRGLFLKEKLANKTLFLTWMKLVYPRLEILDVFAPHYQDRKG